MSWSARSNNVRQRILATPPWIRRCDIDAVYDRRKDGETVDHIIPLNHPYVCGLHVPINLRIVPRATNMHRGNAWCQWHGDLFSEPEQLRILA